MKEMQSANLSGPLKGLRPYHALLGLTQAPGLAGGFDSRYEYKMNKNVVYLLTNYRIDI